MSMKTLEDLLEDQIKDLYNAENQLLKALKKMAKKASNESLVQAFETHAEETQGHIERLDEVGKKLGIKRLTGKTCKAMQGLVEEGKEVLEEDGSDAVIDAALIAAAQRAEHYEISAYGSARAMAEELGQDQVVKLLQETLDEEAATDEKLSQLSEGEILTAANSGEDEDEE